MNKEQKQRIRQTERVIESKPAKRRRVKTKLGSDKRLADERKRKLL